MNEPTDAMKAPFQAVALESIRYAHEEIDDATDAEHIDQCEITSKCAIALGEMSRLRLFRLAGHTEEPPNRMIEWPSVWEMIGDARKRLAIK